MIRSGALLLLCLLARRTAAQSTTSLLPDATVLPRGLLRIRMLAAWTRYDQLLGGGARGNLASGLATDSLTSSRVAALAGPEAAIRAASGLTAFRLTGGQVTAAADARVLTAPLIAEVGLSSRLTLGVVIPLVETRTTLDARLNPALGRANVGPNPALANTAIQAQNTALVKSLITAAATLQARLTQCQTAPTSGTCTTLLAQQATAQSLIQTSGIVSSALATLYGTSDAATPGQAFIPLASDASQTAIAARLQGIRDQYRSLLGSDPITGSVTGANAPGAYGQLQSLLTSAGRDTLQSTNRASIGDITIGAVYQLANTFTDTGASAGRRYRLAANGAFRLGTGQPGNTNRLFDIGTGYGQSGVEAGVAGDLQLNTRWSASAVGSYTVQLGSVLVNRLPNTAGAIFPLAEAVPASYSAGNVMMLAVIPRYRLSGYFGLTGQYNIVHAGADQYTSTSAGTAAATAGFAASTAQQVGLGFTYSTIMAGDRAPGRIPFEVTFSHLETLTASGGPTPKAFRDQVELRVYFRR
jgi:hypothetical protein